VCILNKGDNQCLKTAKMKFLRSVLDFKEIRPPKEPRYEGIFQVQYIVGAILSNKCVKRMQKNRFPKSAAYCKPTGKRNKGHRRNKYNDQVLGENCETCFISLKSNQFKKPAWF
jgi:hypothetical protein